MKKTLALAATAALILLPTAAHAAPYSENHKIGAHMMNPICKGGDTIYRVVLRDDSNRDARFFTSDSTLTSSQASEDYIFAHKRWVKRVRVSGPAAHEVRVTHRGEVLLHHAHLTNVCD